MPLGEGIRDFREAAEQAERFFGRLNLTLNELLAGQKGIEVEIPALKTKVVLRVVS